SVQSSGSYFPFASASRSGRDSAALRDRTVTEPSSGFLPSWSYSATTLITCFQNAGRSAQTRPAVCRATPSSSSRSSRTTYPSRLDAHVVPSHTCPNPDTSTSSPISGQAATCSLSSPAFRRVTTTVWPSLALSSSQRSPLARSYSFTGTSAQASCLTRA